MFDFHLGSKIGASRPRRDRMEGSRRRARAPRLDRRNAIKNIDYEAGVAASESTSWASSSASGAGAGGGGLRASRSLDLSPADYADKTSFRIGGGVEGEVDLLCRSLGLSGPEDFAIPVAAWEARKALSSSSLLPRSRLLDSPAPSPSAVTSPPLDPSPPELDLQVREDRSPSDQPGLEIRARNDSPRADLRSPVSAGGGDGGIRGSRPPVLSRPLPVISALAPPPSRSTLAPPPSRSTLAPPPSRSTLAPPPPMSRRVLDKIGSTWDIVMSLAPDGDEDGGSRRRSFDSDDDDHDYNGEAEEEKVPGGNAEREELWLGMTTGDHSRSCSFSSSNDEDDSSSTTTEAMFISPNDKFRRSIRKWMRGRLLGSGSFGTVYEAISDDGFFFAVKEVLLDEGNNAKQCIFQLEQEIALLSQFEHENIVHYYGTEKEETKLFIFLELVTQGSLASLYQKYHLRDSQVSAYTRQILSGLKYLHDRNVVHRDIKCANILVHANGSVKLADFGLAKEITKFSELKSSKGSVYWMAPEVVNPKRTYGPAADIWSLGCTVLEILTRQIPYPDLEWTQALFRIGRGEKPPIPNSLSKDARDFICQCVRVNPDDRPSAATLLEHSFVRRSLAASEFSDSSSHGNGR